MTLYHWRGKPLLWTWIRNGRKYSIQYAPPVIGKIEWLPRRTYFCNCKWQTPNPHPRCRWWSVYYSWFDLCFGVTTVFSDNEKAHVPLADSGRDAESKP
jgi:hypothetical protein